MQKQVLSATLAALEGFIGEIEEPMSARKFFRGALGLPAVSIAVVAGGVMLVATVFGNGGSAQPSNYGGVAHFAAPGPVLGVGLPGLAAWGCISGTDAGGADASPSNPDRAADRRVPQRLRTSGITQRAPAGPRRGGAVGGLL